MELKEERVARQALEKLVRIREEKVERLERRIAAMESHVQALMEIYAVPAFPSENYPYDILLNSEKEGCLQNVKASSSEALDGKAPGDRSRKSSKVACSPEKAELPGAERDGEASGRRSGKRHREAFFPSRAEVCEGDGRPFLCARGEQTEARKERSAVFLLAASRQKTLDFFYDGKNARHCAGKQMEGPPFVNQNCDIGPQVLSPSTRMTGSEKIDFNGNQAVDSRVLDIRRERCFGLDKASEEPEGADVFRVSMQELTREDFITSANKSMREPGTENVLYRAAGPEVCTGSEKMVETAGCGPLGHILSSRETFSGPQLQHRNEERSPGQEPHTGHCRKLHEVKNHIQGDHTQGSQKVEDLICSKPQICVAARDVPLEDVGDPGAMHPDSYNLDTQQKTRALEQGSDARKDVTGSYTVKTPIVKSPEMVEDVICPRSQVCVAARDVPPEEVAAVGAFHSDSSNLQTGNESCEVARDICMQRTKHVRAETEVWNGLGQNRQNGKFGEGSVMNIEFSSSETGISNHTGLNDEENLKGGSMVSCGLNSDFEEGVEKPTLSWRPKARPCSSSSSSDPSAISVSLSADATCAMQVDEDEVVQTNRYFMPYSASKANKWRTSTVKEKPKILRPDASLEDIFDWTVLGALSSTLWPDRLVSPGHHVRVSRNEALPLSFLNGSHYAATFQPLIMEECKAIFNNDWDTLKKASRSGSSLWSLEHLANEDSPFCFIQGHQESGLPAENCEVVLLASRQTLEIKALGMVQNVLESEVLIRTREQWENCPQQCVVLKVSNLITVKRMYIAVSSLGVIYRPLRSQVLNPCCGDFTSENSDSSRPTFLSEWRARGIFNDSQLSAIGASLNLQWGFLLVQGPPGTGKTTTVAGMVSALLIKEPASRILVCAGSNPALDEVVARLAHGLVDRSGKWQTPAKGVLVRVGPKGKVRKDCMDVYLDHLRLHQTGAPSRAVATEWTLKNASIICSTLSGSRHSLLDELKHPFDVLIVDEAAQATEPEAIIALKKVSGRCILVGDHCQLPATVLQQPSTAFGRSLFERMQDAGVRVHMLKTQYRMHPELSIFPSSQFYNNNLEDAAEVCDMKSIFTWTTQHQWIASGGYHFELGRLCFLDVNWGSHQKDGTNASFLNREEASVVVAIVEAVSRGLMEGARAKIGVITPYAAQKKVITHALNSRGVHDKMCEVDTVDGFQGREKDVIVLSCVRAGAQGGMGFLADPRRMCVALTRAKHALIIVGHSRTLEKHQLWRSFIQHARHRNCMKPLFRSR